MSKFVHLRVYSDYSLGSSAIRVKDLVRACLTHNFPALALTDKNNLFASLEYSMEAVKNGVQPIAGLDICVEYEKDVYGNVIIIAKDKIGYANILKLASNIFLKRSTSKQLSINFQELIELGKGLIILAGNPIDSVEKHLFGYRQQDTFKFLKQLAEIFKDRLYIEIIRKSQESEEDLAFEVAMIDYAYGNNIPLVATNYASFLNSSFYEAQDAMSCIANGRYLLEDNRPRLDPGFYLKSADEMEELFSDLPEAINNTIVIAKRCSVYSEGKPPLLPKFIQDEKISEAEVIREQAINGLKQRISKLSLSQELQKQYFDRLDFELSIINKMKYAGYFLIVSDFIRWSKEQGIPVGPGRGSGAGSIVAWALAITDLDPIKFGLLFERFLNPERVSMPDFDIDFCQERREEVIEYVKSKYGSDKVAQIITYGKLQARAVLRDVGRVLHMPYGVIDKICKMVPNNPANPVTLGEAITLDKELQKSKEADPEIEKLLNISLQLEGLNRHVSTHAAGVVIADRPIIEIVPLYLDDAAKMPAVQYSMKYAEAAGLIKFDFLGLKTLTVISWTTKLLKAKGVGIDLENLSLDDPQTYAMLSKGLTTGVFQFESAGMKEAIKRLKPDSIEDLIALGSLYRPGPMDNIPSYINRKHGLEQPEYLHPRMENCLRETYGIIVYQEQVMEIARELAGYTLGGADLLRRAMGKKIRSEMEAQREVFVQGCVANNIDRSKAQEIFDLIEKFASYGFNKSHAAAYAIISYQTGYLKANHTKEFLVASINSEIHDTDKINIFLQEAKKFNIPIVLPDINKSEAVFTVEGEAIRFGLGAIKNVGVSAVSKIIEERKCGEFKSIYDLVERCGKAALNRRMFEGLCKSGALDCLEENRNKVLHSVDMLLRYAHEYAIQKESTQVGLFSFDDADIDQKPQLENLEKWNTDEALQREFEAFGFYLSSHPLAPFGTKLKKLGVVESDTLEGMLSRSKGVKISLAGVITARKVKSSKRGKYAIMQISDRQGLVEISVFSEEMLHKYDDLLQIGNVIFVTADARVDESGLRIMVDSICQMGEALSRVNTVLSVLIKDQRVIEEVSSLVGPSGKKVSMALKLEGGEIISFSSSQPIYITPENEMRLRKISGVEVVEY
ncbi:MAG: DNA polymerase III subunit alpha [Candidatus Jidaibacter sp.]|jgi:DNA polymerase-3 subunit alpha|nr:DNA polymerase III subunit alpha [Candidatus Jidaibacter sp.]